MPDSSGMIDKHEIKLSLGNLRFDRDLYVGWEINPSIGFVAKDIDRMGLELESFEEPIKRSIMIVMIPSIRKNFEKEGRPDKWQKLAPYTLQRKGLAGVTDGDKPLHWTGALKRAATQFRIWHINSSNTGASITSLPDNVWYGALHQNGFGGFGEFVKQAEKLLGSKAGGLPILKKAFELMDAERGPGGHKAAQIPQRRFLLFQEDDIDDIQLVFYEWLVEVTIREGKFRS